MDSVPWFDSFLPEMKSRLIYDDRPAMPGCVIFSTEAGAVAEAEMTGSTNRLGLHKNIAQSSLSVTSNTDLRQLPVQGIRREYLVHFPDISFTDLVFRLMTFDFDQSALTDLEADRVLYFREEDGTIHDNCSVD